MFSEYYVNTKLIFSLYYANIYFCIICQEYKCFDGFYVNSYYNIKSSVLSI